MGEQHEVTTRQPLLNKKGIIAEPGWAKELVWAYNPENIAAPWFRKKEWDYYLVADDHKGVAFTMSDLGYAGMGSLSVLDFDAWTEHTMTVVTPPPFGKYGLGLDSDQGFGSIKHGDIHLVYSTEKNKRRIRCRYQSFMEGMDLEADIVLYQPPMDSMCIATPWREKPTAFYYNQKINCMPASGWLRLGDTTWHFKPSVAMAVLDWGRGVWTYDNTWYWGTGSGFYEGVPFGFNLGYGFSDRSSASENMVFYNNKAHKLDRVTFNIPEDSKGNRKYLEPWQITSNDGRFEGFFIPGMDRQANINLVAVKSFQHQIFGHLTAKVTLDDGRVLEIKNFLCSIEVIHNRY